ncbi:sigma-54-dependent Fis family transcriptional regulator [Bacillus sp. NEB1478]|uniref:sigma-54-dependent Fis family transcriptional regulator n=1 Tax=Bacillus sp. NEB1478 TaxID=3073816 RepID=UPI0028730F63|nr:sigma-54-dependent Fis family transcriptional regulator [Bacillus sp. NEB1478]WNB93601.1 sigma-54-dependent Fis family transcriptional regulator [Bacillus sp. NEB1478]
MLQRVILVVNHDEAFQLLQLIRSSDVFKTVGLFVSDDQIADTYSFDNVQTFTLSSIPDIDAEFLVYSHLNKETADQLNKHFPASCMITADQFNGLLNHMESVSLKNKNGSLHQLKTVLDNTHDGMIVINNRLEITIFNKSAEKMTGISKEEAIGKSILKVMPNSQLPRVLDSGIEEINQEQILENGTKIFTTRTPIFDQNSKVLGSFAVFKDITEIVNLAEEVTNLKSIQSMLTSIIQSSEEAISVVDEQGKGILINPAYTRLTGYTAEQVIGKPATTDISEGESIHMQVLKTRKPIRGARLKVGPSRKDVIVNVAPMIVDGLIKGSVGVILDVSEIKGLTEELYRARQIIRTLEAKYSFEDIIGESEEMKFAVDQGKLAASTPATVLLRGESGTGKELFAHAIHNASDRKFNKFVRVNCAALSESLLESELFGYVEGAFSGALRGGKRGLFEEANGGSIFLDEVGELSQNTQAKLLRVLQENEIRRVGGTKAIPINVRVIAATNVNLEKMIAESTFRQDLYYRLNRMPIYIPPLRLRNNDILLLAKHLLQKLNQDYGRNIEVINKDAEEFLLDYHWPGNVRELENILGRAIIHMSHTDTQINRSHISLLSNNHNKPNSASIKVMDSLISEKSLTDRMDEFEKGLLIEALKTFDGNKTRAAKSLGISLRNFYYKLEKFGVDEKARK